jgi:hypothetical protein
MRRYFEQKEIKCAGGKILLVRGLTLINSLVVTTTYFQSANDFLWHNKVVDHQLTQGSEPWEMYLLTASSVMCAFVLVSNQFGMASHISKFLSKACCMKMTKIKKSDVSWPVLVTITIGAACKAVISSSSLLSSVRDITSEWWASGACSAVSLIGNFGATAVVLLEHSGWHGNRSPCVAKIWAWVVGALYGISQGCLYSNALFNPLLLTGILKERPWFVSDSIGKQIFWASFLPLITFSIGSGQVIYDKTCKVLGDKEVEEKRPRLSKPRHCCQSVQGVVASGYRVLALLAAVFCFFYFLSGDNLTTTGIITALSSLAAPGVIAVLYPFPRSNRGTDLPTSAAGGYHRLFTINESDDDSDDEQYLVPYLP